MRVLGLAIALTLWACADKDSTAGKGGIWDETENSVQAVVLDSSGKPLKGVRIRWITMNDWIKAKEAGLPPPFDSATTDADGRLAIARSDSEDVLVLEAIRDSLGAKVQLAAGKDSALLVLKGTVNLSGSLTGSNLPDSIFLAGSSHASPVGVDGAFQFKKVATGLYGLVGMNNKSIHLVNSAEVGGDSLLRMDSLAWMTDDGILLEDFEDAVPANRFHALGGSGWWYTYGDSASQIIPSDVMDAIVTDGDAWMGGHSLHMVFAVQTDVAGKFALCGFDLESSGLTDSTSPAVLHNLDGVDSISFWAKGTGTIKLQLTSANSLIAPVEIPFSLATEWTRYTVPREQFAASPLWSQLAFQVTAINFLAQEPAELWLDQIFLHGVAESDVFYFMRRSTP